jgi:hypothetical protein
MNTDKHRLHRTQYLCLSVFICGSNKNLLIPRSLPQGRSLFLRLATFKRKRGIVK